MLGLTVLGSGSAGNCSVLSVGEQSRSRLLLIDAGLSPRDAAARLDGALSRRLDEVTDLFLTHLDGDHWRPSWSRFIRRHGVRVHLHRAHEGAAIARGVPADSIRTLDDRDDPHHLDDGLRVQAVRAPHDAQGSTAWLCEWTSGREVARLGFATDLGRVPPRLFERFRDLDLLAFESNYDPELQAASGRPAWLKARITGGRGHLSNDASLEAVRRMSRASRLQAIVLLHLSRECNRPELVERLWREEVPDLAERLIVTDQRRPAPTAIARPRLRGEFSATSLFDLLEHATG